MDIKKLQFEDDNMYMKELMINVDNWYSSNISFVLENDSVLIFSLDRNQIENNLKQNDGTTIGVFLH
jgi:hypothetical protein